ncbi:hypothetical protein [Desertivirga xinjiangensis]|uniref:hypothetical protein n=1 Tax=Desertivirga xinjiangensis TaxID=539206 RepID=UPI002108EA01|nr:hypothetical protein [Pedobacter xinjiangensis]
MCPKLTFKSKLTSQVGGAFAPLKKNLTQNKQNLIIGLMLAVLLVSAYMSFFVNPHTESSVAKQKIEFPFARGDVPINAFTSLIEIINLQSQLSAIKAKDSVTVADTLLLRSSIDQLHSIQSTFKKYR